MLSVRVLFSHLPQNMQRYDRQNNESWFFLWFLSSRLRLRTFERIIYPFRDVFHFNSFISCSFTILRPVSLCRLIIPHPSSPFSTAHLNAVSCQYLTRRSHLNVHGWHPVLVIFLSPPRILNKENCFTQQNFSLFLGGIYPQEKTLALFVVFKTLITLCLINIQDLSACRELSPCILKLLIPTPNLIRF